jgi:hypothetical protein
MQTGETGKGSLDIFWLAGLLQSSRSSNLRSLRDAADQFTAAEFALASLTAAVVRKRRPHAECTCSEGLNAAHRASWVSTLARAFRLRDVMLGM